MDLDLLQACCTLCFSALAAWLMLVTHMLHCQIICNIAAQSSADHTAALALKSLIVGVQSWPMLLLQLPLIWPQPTQLCQHM